MDFLIRFVELLDTKMTTPEPFGWFHLMWIAIVVILSVLAVLWARKRPDEKTVRKTVLIVSLVVLLFEIYKQVNFTFKMSDGAITAKYQWYGFPFQFCSTPMYAGLLAGLVKRGMVRRALCSYIATYGIFAGLCVMAYPGDVFCATAGINIQTMVCHSAMIILGVYLFATDFVRAELKTILRALAVFVSMVLVAASLNEIVYYTNASHGETFNMFFFSRHFPSTLPVYGPVHAALPFPLALVIYVAGFTAAAFLVLLLGLLLKKLLHALGARKRAEQ